MKNIIFFKDDIKWKHVKLDISRENKVDWSHEREWRIKKDSSIIIADFNFSLLFPNNKWKYKYISLCEIQIAEYSLIMDDLLAYQYVDIYPSISLTQKS
jgi:hypothetical protein